MTGRADERLSNSCAWCGQQIIAGQPSVLVVGEPMHLDCAADESDNAFFDRDMED